MISRDVKLGKDVNISDTGLVNIYGCEIGDKTFVGPFVEITKGAVIGRGCVIESHSYICTGVTIEDNVFIGHGVMFVNDLFPWPGKKAQFLATLIKSDAVIGSGATIIGGITIGRCAVVGAGSVVLHDVPDFSITAGNPARILKHFNTHDEISSYMSNRQPLRMDE